MSLLEREKRFWDCRYYFEKSKKTSGNLISKNDISSKVMLENNSAGELDASEIFFHHIKLR